MGGAVDQTPGGQYNPSVVGEMLGDPGTLLQLLGAVIPNFYSNNMVFRPREALSTLGQMYGRTADRAALQEEIKKMPGMFPMPSGGAGQMESVQPYQGPPRPQVQTSLPAGTQVPVQRDYVAEAKRLTGYRPPGLAESFAKLSPRGQRAAMGSQTAFGTWADVFGTTRQEAMGDIGRQKEHLLQETLAALQERPEDTKLQEAVILLSQQSETQAQRFAAQRGLTDLFRGNLPDHEKGQAGIYARVAPTYALERMKEHREATDQLQQFEQMEQAGQLPGNNAGIRRIFTYAAKFARPLPPAEFSKLLFEETAKQRVVEAEKQFPQLETLRTSPWPLPTIAERELDAVTAKSTFAEMHARGFGDVVPHFENLQREGLKYEETQRQHWRLFEEQRRASQAREAEAERLHDVTFAGQQEAREWRRLQAAAQSEDRKIAAEAQQELRRGEQSRRLYESSLHADERIQNYTKMRGVIEEANKIQVDSSTGIPKETYEDYLARLRQTIPVYSAIEKSLWEAQDAKKRIQIDRSLFDDPSGRVLIDTDLAEWKDRVTQVQADIAAGTPSSHPRILGAVDKLQRSLERTRGMYRNYPKVVGMWEAKVYVVVNLALNELRRALSPTSPVHPPGATLPLSPPRQPSLLTPLEIRPYPTGIR